MSPKASSGAATLRLFMESVPTPIGSIALVTDDVGDVRALDWNDYLPRLNRLLQVHYGTAVERDAAAAPSGDESPAALFRQRTTPSAASLALRRYFAGDIPAIETLTVATGGTAFQQAVWTALRRIPAGETTSYGALASSIGRPRAVRAVGHANGSNPIGIIVPCHRVIGVSGHLTGYAGGLERKRWLLEHETAHAG